jgi:hypothetical protein
MSHFSSKVAAIILVFMGTAQAATIDHGTYSVDYTAASHLFIKGLPGFSNTYFSMGGDGTLFGDERNVEYFEKRGSIAASFHAASGKVFDKLVLYGTSGVIAHNWAGGSYAGLAWSIPGATFVGESTLSGVKDSSRPLASYLEITGPSTGISVAYSTYPDRTNILEGVPGNGYYDIGAADFSINLDSVIATNWGSLIGLNTLVFGVSFRDAPPITSPVPEPETYAMMLAGLGLLGAMTRRRKQKSVA